MANIQSRIADGLLNKLPIKVMDTDLSLVSQVHLQHIDGQLVDGRISNASLDIGHLGADAATMASDDVEKVATVC